MGSSWTQLLSEKFSGGSVERCVVWSHKRGNPPWQSRRRHGLNQRCGVLLCSSSGCFLHGTDFLPMSYVSEDRACTKGKRRLFTGEWSSLTGETSALPVAGETGWSLGSHRGSLADVPTSRSPRFNSGLCCPFLECYFTRVNPPCLSDVCLRVTFVWAWHFQAGLVTVSCLFTDHWHSGASSCWSFFPRQDDLQFPHNPGQCWAIADIPSMCNRLMGGKRMNE